MATVELIYNNTSSFIEVEELDRTRSVTPSKAAEMVEGLMATLQSEVVGKRPEPTCVVTWRRMLKLSAYEPAAQAMLEAGILHLVASLLDGAHPENLLSPPYCAEATTLMLLLTYTLVDRLRPVVRVSACKCFITPSLLHAFVRLLRMAVSRSHFPVLVPWLRFFTILYDSYGEVRRLAKDKDVPATLSSLQEASDAMLPKPLSEATLALLRTMQQWLPRHGVKLKPWQRDTSGSAALSAATKSFASSAAAARDDDDDTAAGAPAGSIDYSSLRLFSTTSRSVFDPALTKVPLGAGRRYDSATATDIITSDSMLLPTPKQTLFGTVYTRPSGTITTQSRSIFSEASSLRDASVLSLGKSSGGDGGTAASASASAAGGPGGVLASAYSPVGGAGTPGASASGSSLSNTRPLTSPIGSPATTAGLNTALQQASQLAAMIGYDRLAELEGRKPAKSKPVAVPTAPVGSIEETVSYASSLAATGGAGTGMGYEPSFYSTASSGGGGGPASSPSSGAYSGHSGYGYGHTGTGTGSGHAYEEAMAPRSVQSIFSSTGGGDAVDVIMTAKNAGRGAGDASPRAPLSGAGVAGTPTGKAVAGRRAGTASSGRYGASASGGLPASASLLESPTFSQSIASHTSTHMPILQAQYAAATGMANQAYSLATQSPDKMAVSGHTGRAPSAGQSRMTMRSRGGPPGAT